MTTVCSQVVSACISFLTTTLNVSSSLLCSQFFQRLGSDPFRCLQRCLSEVFHLEMAASCWATEASTRGQPEKSFQKIMVYASGSKRDADPIRFFSKICFSVTQTLMTSPDIHGISNQGNMYACVNCVSGQVCAVVTAIQTYTCTCFPFRACLIIFARMCMCFWCVWKSDVRLCARTRVCSCVGSESTIKHSACACSEHCPGVQPSLCALPSLCPLPSSSRHLMWGRGNPEELVWYAPQQEQEAPFGVGKSHTSPADSGKCNQHQVSDRSHGAQQHANEQQLNGNTRQRRQDPRRMVQSRKCLSLGFDHQHSTVHGSVQLATSASRWCLCSIIV